MMVSSTIRQRRKIQISPTTTTTTTLEITDSNTSTADLSKRNHSNQSNNVDDHFVTANEDSMNICNTSTNRTVHGTTTNAPGTVPTKPQPQPQPQSQHYCCYESKYRIAKWLIVRMTAFIYTTAFMVALYQNHGLFGHANSLQPVQLPMEQYIRQHTIQYMEKSPINDESLPKSLSSSLSSLSSLSIWCKIDGFMQRPMIFWFVPYSDSLLLYITYIGVVISLIQLIFCTSWLIQLICWILYFTIVTTADISNTSFYGYGWESQILETGFLTIFLCTLPHTTNTILHTTVPIANSIAKKDTNMNKNSPQRTTSQTTRRFSLALYEKSHLINNNNSHSTNRTWVHSSSSVWNGEEPSTVVLWLFQWLSFRIAVGAGLIKIRGSSCWTDKTCLHYHFETQPIPSPLSFAFHFFPKWIHVHMVYTDLIVQLYTAWFLLFPPVHSAVTNFLLQSIQRTCAMFGYECTWTKWIVSFQLFFLRSGGFLQIFLMIGILVSGNFSVLNWLTIIPALACFDDQFWPQHIQRMLLGIPRQHTQIVARVENEILSNIATERHSGDSDGTNTDASDADNTMESRNVLSALNDGELISTPSTITSTKPEIPISRRIVDVLLLLLILYLSRPVVDNLLQWNSSRRQQMNASYDPFRLVNTYGAFGSVGTARYEAIVQVSTDGFEWKEIQFPCKPGNINRRPCFCAPYHYRVDWNIWFLGFPPHSYYLRHRESWLFNLLVKLLTPSTAGDNATTTRPWMDLLDSSTSKFLQTTYYNNKITSLQPKAPLYAKVDMYHYRMVAPLWTILKASLLANHTKSSTTTTTQDGYEVGVWWERKYHENLVPVVKLDLNGRLSVLVSN